MSINPFSNSLTGVAENTLYGGFVCASIIKHGGAGVTAFVRRMLTFASGHDRIEARSVLMICKLIAVIVCNEIFTWLR